MSFLLSAQIQMVYIDNTQTKREIDDAIRGNSVSNVAPSQVNNSIQPVININPKDYRKINICTSITRTSGGTTTLITSDANKDTFLTNVYAVWNMDVATAITTHRIRFTQDGATKDIFFPNTNLVVCSGGISIDFLYPIKIDRNTAVTFVVTSTAGNYSCTGGIAGYSVEV